MSGLAMSNQPEYFTTAGGESAGGTAEGIECGRYPGGKNAEGTWQWLLAQMPPHSRYIEPFVGSGALLRRKAPALSTVVVDRDVLVIDWWRRLALPGVTAVHGCGIAWLIRHADELDADTLVYCDPPYPLATRTKTKLYAHELTDEQHRLLLGTLLSLPCPVMVSGYSWPDYEQALHRWHRQERDVITRGGTWRTEVLWCNYTPGAIEAGGGLGRVTGRNYRERERIAKKVRRWRRMFSECPPHERRALLESLIDEEQRLAQC